MAFNSRKAQQSEPALAGKKSKPGGRVGERRAFVSEAKRIGEAVGRWKESERTVIASCRRRQLWLSSSVASGGATVP